MNTAPGGMDPLKILPLIMPNMDPAIRHMLKIMQKTQELMSLMGESIEDTPADASSDNSSSSEDLAAKLREGLTPEQQSMITSMTSMLNL